MANVSWALQVALYEKLKAELSCAVYSDVPQDEPFPYAVIGDETTNNRDFYVERLDQRIVNISVWSSQSSKKEVKSIVADIDAALHRQKLPLTTGTLVSLVIENTQVTRDLDERTYMGNVTLSAYTQR